mgnify:CR=1 FL=1
MVHEGLLFSLVHQPHALHKQRYAKNKNVTKADKMTDLFAI